MCGDTMKAQGGREEGKEGGREDKGKDVPSWRRYPLSEGGEEARVDVPELLLHGGGKGLLEAAQGLGEGGREVGR